MNSPDPAKVSGGPQPASLARACILLSSALLAASPFFFGYGYWRSQLAGVAAAGIAGLVCWLGGILALVIGWLMGSGTPAALNGVLAGMFFRMGLPLITGLALHRQGGWVAEAGVLGMIVGFYLVTLIVETGLAVRIAKSAG